MAHHQRFNVGELTDASFSSRAHQAMFCDSDCVFVMDVQSVSILRNAPWPTRAGSVCTSIGVTTGSSTNDVWSSPDGSSESAFFLRTVKLLGGPHVPNEPSHRSSGCLATLNVGVRVELLVDGARQQDCGITTVSCVCARRRTASAHQL